MTHAIETKPIFPISTPSWVLGGAVAAILSIVFHEVAHFLMAHASGAADIQFHWADVYHDEASVSAVGNALIALFGPVSSYAMALVGWWVARQSSSPFALAFGFNAAFRNLAVLPFTIKSLLGRDTSTFFFDEIIGSQALGVSPLYFVIPSLIVGLLGTTYFTRQAYRDHGLKLMMVMIVASFLGVYLWGVVGPIVLPGGHGFN